MALVYQHRAYDPGAGAFVYWQAPSLDLAGTFWAGPPAFGTLIDVLVLRVFDDGGPAGETGGFPASIPRLSQIIIPNRPANGVGLAASPAASARLGPPIPP
jgi:hypothetical protein